MVDMRQVRPLSGEIMTDRITLPPDGAPWTDAVDAEFETIPR